MGYTFVMLLESQQLNIFSYSCKKDLKNGKMSRKEKKKKNEKKRIHQDLNTQSLV